MPTCYLPAIKFSTSSTLARSRKWKSSYSDKTLILIPVSIMESAFRTERSSHSRFSGKHIQGNTSGPGKAHSDFRKSGPLGSARRVSYEFRPHSTCPRNRLAPEHGMGNLHRRCYQETEWWTGESCIHALGSVRQRKAALINSSRHLILTTVHPSPRSAEYGFFGCRHFSKANDFLRSRGIQEIDW